MSKLAHTKRKKNNNWVLSIKFLIYHFEHSLRFGKQTQEEKIISDLNSIITRLFYFLFLVKRGSSGHCCATAVKLKLTVPLSLNVKKNIFSGYTNLLNFILKHLCIKHSEHFFFLEFSLRLFDFVFVIISEWCCFLRWRFLSGVRTPFECFIQCKPDTINLLPFRIVGFGITRFFQFENVYINRKIYWLLADRMNRWRNHFGDLASVFLQFSQINARFWVANLSIIAISKFPSITKYAFYLI